MQNEKDKLGKTKKKKSVVHKIEEWIVRTLYFTAFIINVSVANAQWTVNPV
jgi:hypothetical protein